MTDQVFPIPGRPTAFPVKFKDMGDGSFAEVLYAVVNAFGSDPLPAGGNHIGKIGADSAVATASFNRPADTTAYAVGDLIANSTTAGSVVPMQITAARENAGTGSITRCRLSCNKAGMAGTETFRVHLFKNAPSAANGDNGAFNINGLAAVHLGFFEVTLDQVFSDGAKGFAAPYIGSQIIFDAAAGSQLLYALIESRSAWTPGSGNTFTVALEVLRD